jgi:hypothetical protein
MTREYSWIIGYTGHCSMELVEIIRSEITVLNAVTPMLLRKQSKNERRLLKSQELERPGLHRKLATRNSKHWQYRTFG